MFVKVLIKESMGVSSSRNNSDAPKLAQNCTKLVDNTLRGF